MLIKTSQIIDMKNRLAAIRRLVTSRSVEDYAWAVNVHVDAIEKFVDELGELADQLQEGVVSNG